MAATPVGRLFGKDDALARLQDHAARLLRMQRVVESALPKSMRDGVAVANFQDGTLALHAANPSVASRLNMSVDSLSAALQAKGEAVMSIKVRVRAIRNAATSNPNAGHARHLGDQGRAAWDALQSKVDAASPLGAAITRMLRNSG